MDRRQVIGVSSDYSKAQMDGTGVGSRVMAVVLVDHGVECVAGCNDGFCVFDVMKVKMYGRFDYSMVAIVDGSESVRF